MGGARGQPQREFPCRRSALHAGRSPAARVRAGAERRLRDGELRTAQPPSPAGAAGSVPQRSPPPGTRTPGPQRQPGRPQSSVSSGHPGLRRHSINEVSPHSRGRRLSWENDFPPGQWWRRQRGGARRARRGRGDVGTGGAREVTGKGGDGEGAGLAARR